MGWRLEVLRYLGLCGFLQEVCVVGTGKSEHGKDSGGVTRLSIGRNLAPSCFVPMLYFHHQTLGGGITKGDNKTLFERDMRGAAYDNHLKETG